MYGNTATPSVRADAEITLNGNPSLTALWPLLHVMVLGSTQDFPAFKIKSCRTINSSFPILI